LAKTRGKRISASPGGKHYKRNLQVCRHGSKDYLYLI
jgi:hypothetical protein